MTPLPLGHVRILRKKKLAVLLEASRDPRSTTCSQCGLDVEPEEVEDAARNINWIVRYCLHCGNRSVARIDLTQRNVDRAGL